MRIKLLPGETVDEAVARVKRQGGYSGYQAPVSSTGKVNVPGAHSVYMPPPAPTAVKPVLVPSIGSAAAPIEPLAITKSGKSPRLSFGDFNF